MKLKTHISFLLLVIVTGIFLGSCSKAQNDTNTNRPALKDAFADMFYFGTALNRWQTMGIDTTSLIIAKTQFNALTSENDMKWEMIHPKPGKYNFEAVDKFVEFGQENNMFLVGHTLVWHSQIPRWVFEDENGKPASRDTLLSRLKDHIYTVVGRYKGKVKGWDVVNEAFNDDGSMRQTPYLKIIGEDYFEKVFQYAHEADPEAELYYNDYSMTNPARRDAVVKTVDSLRKKGVQIDGIGMQMHAGLNYPTSSELEDAIKAYASTGANVMITEMDISILPNPFEEGNADISLRFKRSDENDPYVNGIPDSMKIVQAQRYADLFKIFIKHNDKISRVSIWGINDNQSWKNNFPIRGRFDYPLLFDRNNQPKIVVDSIIKCIYY